MEIWALNSTLDHEKWDRSSNEHAHLDFLRHIVGVNRSVNNLLCRTEVGRFFINIEINYKILSFYKRIKDFKHAHLDFLRHIVGVNRSVNNLLCQTEVGRFFINIEINYKILSFYKHIKNFPEHSIAHQTMHHGQ